MIFHRSFALVFWMGLLIIPSALVICADQVSEEFFEGVQDDISAKRQRENNAAKSGSDLDSHEEGSSINRDKSLQHRVFTLMKFQEPFEIIVNKAQKSGGRDSLSQTLETISNSNGFLEILERCLSARPNIRCNARSPYRTYDGTCNNLGHPRWGSVLSCNERILKASYEGPAGFRRSVKSKKELPPPRYLSLNLLTHYHRPTDCVSNLFTFFGQLVDHDLTNTAPTTANGDVLQCCPPQKNAPAQCAPILISPDDPFYSRHNITCINFVRNAPCPTCTFEKRVQINQVTSFLDCSFVYNVDEKRAKELRTLDGTGTLKLRDTEEGKLLPTDPDTSESQCGSAEKEEFCFKAGDGRVNQHTPLMIMQTIFPRLHNKLAGKLKCINSHWNDEKIFQETRKILIAIFQNIVFQEYLPTLLGDYIMSKYDLWVDGAGYTEYYRTVNPAMLTEFNTAGFRLHAMVNSIVVTGGPKFRFQYNLASPIYRGHLDEILKGMIDTPAQKFGPHLVDDVKNFLYRSLGEKSGLDLNSFNIQRGRDHGLPTFCDMLEYYLRSKTKITKFDDLEPYVYPEYIEQLKEIYEDVRDIDLWAGLLVERIDDGHILGNTTEHINGEQFRRLKFGDRYFFTNRETSGSLTEQQLIEVKKSTLAWVICETTDIEIIPKSVLLLPCAENPFVECSMLPAVNLSHWRSQPSYY